MQLSYTSWAAPATPYPLPLKIININSKLSAVRTRNPSQNNGNINDNNDGDGDDDSGVVKFHLPFHVKSITSTSNPFVKHCLKLRHSSSYRHSHGSVLVVGATPIREIYKFETSLQDRTVRMDCLLLLDKVEVPEGLYDISTHTVRVSSVVMKKLCGVQSSESIEAVALMKIPTSFFNIDANQKGLDCRSWFPSTHRLLVLDGIQDPGNLGSLLRSAMAFKWGGVFLLPGCCDPFNEKALRASRGACFQLPIVSGSWYHLEALKNEFQMKLLGGHPESLEGLRPVARLSQELVEALADIPICLVLGSEGHGLSEKSLQVCELGTSYENMTIIVKDYVDSLINKYPYWNRTLGADHFFVTCHDVGVRATEGVPFLIKNAIRVVCSPSYDVAFIPHKDVALPQVLQPFALPRGGNDLENRTNLGFWAGHRNSKIRVILARLWENDTELDISNNRISRAIGPLVYQKRFYRTKFCICPGGSQVNSARIADSIHYGCVPVILSNYYDLPFNDILDWSKFAVILRENDVYQLKQILKNISDAEFVSLHKNLVKVQKHFQWNSPPIRLDAFHMVMYELWLRHHVIKY